MEAEGISDLNKLSDYPDSLRSLSGLSAPNPIVGYPNQTIEIRIAPMSIKQNKKCYLHLNINSNTVFKGNQYKNNPFLK